MNIQIIAEVGSAWRVGDIDESKETLFRAVDEAAWAGATIFKVQYFRSDTLYSKIRAPDLYERARYYELPLEWLPELKHKCHSHNLSLWASVFSVDLIELALPYLDGLKVASGDFTNRGLTMAMAKAAEKARIPLALSTGAATEEEMSEELYHLFYTHPKELILMHCVSSYPARSDEMNLRALSPYMFRYDWVDRWGLSDHTRNDWVSPLALAMGYTVFEKHLMPAGASNDNPDAVVAFRPARFRDYVQSLHDTDKILGTGKKEVQASEANERIWARRGKDGLRPAND